MLGMLAVIAAGFSNFFLHWTAEGKPLGGGLPIPLPTQKQPDHVNFSALTFNIHVVTMPRLWQRRRRLETTPLASFMVAIIRLEASKQGFKTKTVSDIELLVSQRVRIDVALEVRALTQTVEVSAGETRLLETQTSEVGHVIKQRAQP